MTGILALFLGFLLDVCFGDPPKIPHVVVGIGKCISGLEKALRRLFPATPAGETAGGILLAILVPSLWGAGAWGLLYACDLIHPAFRIAVEAVLCWQCLALKGLRQESMRVYTALQQHDIGEARQAVGRIVGRDTAALDAAGVVRAAVETVAENASDGVIAPLFFLAIGGAPMGIVYKAINTMDSMVGYKNDRHFFVGKAAARLDDVVNLLPSRIAGIWMALCAPLAGLNGKGAWRIFLRDRYNHKSPNSAQTEAACAGALGVRLGGDSFYFGKLVHKPTIGDDLRPIEAEDIVRANRLLYWTSVVCFLLCMAVKGALLW